MHFLLDFNDVRTLSNMVLMYPLVGVHKCTAFKVKVLTITCLGNTVEQTLLKVSGQYGLIEHFLLFGYIE